VRVVETCKFRVLGDWLYRPIVYRDTCDLSSNACRSTPGLETNGNACSGRSSGNVVNGCKDETCCIVIGAQTGACPDRCVNGAHNIRSSACGPYNKNAIQALDNNISPRQNAAGKIDRVRLQKVVIR
jgi:hypothetical protein